jgi:membrane protease YdiL (CAAX protease family)
LKVDFEMAAKGKNLREIFVFLILTILFSTLAYIPIIQAGTIDGGYSKLGGLLMLAPGLAAVITYLGFERSLRPIGWRLGKLKYLLIGGVIPLIYCLITYGVAWLNGLGKFNGQFLPGFPLILVTLLLNSTLSALLEEVAWRGFLVPKLITLTSFTSTALITGLVWSFWHYPLILFTNVRMVSTPVLYSLACFTVFAVGLSFAAAWLRLRSGSVWTAALLHGSHNVFMLHIFNTLTADTGSTWLWLGEYGMLSAVVGLLLGVIFWCLRNRLTGDPLLKSNRDI